MAVTVGTLIVDLQANTASFVTGLDKAGQIALDSGKNIEKALTSMAASVTTAFFAVEGALAAMLDHVAENAARLYDMAQVTGVSTAALSGLEYAAKQSGLSTEQLDGALTKMSKSLDKAAQGGISSSNAYKTLGVTIKDANGQLLPTTAILASLADKFQSFKDGPEKTALAIQIFGKAGAAMVPLLNRGSAGIDDLMKEAKALGIVIDDDTAAASKKFEESMNKLKAAAEGAATTLLTKLLPSAQQIIDNVTAGAEESDSRFKAIINSAAVVGKAFIVAFGGVQTFFDSLREYVQAFESDVVLTVSSLGQAGAALLKGNVKDAVNALKDGNSLIEANDKASTDKQLQIWKEYGAGVVSFWDATVQGIAKKPITGTANAPAPPNADQSKFTDTVNKQIAVLQAAADKLALLAAAQKGSSAATIEATAAAEAESVITKLNTEAEQKHVQVLNDAQKARITQAATERAFAQIANELSKTLADEVTKTNEQRDATLRMAAAFEQGGAAIQAAQEASKIEPFAQKVNALQVEFVKLATSGKASGAELATMAKDLANANTQYQNAVASVHALATAQQATASSEELTKLSRTIDSTKQYTIAVSNGAAALRAFNIEQQVLAYTRNPALDQSTEAVNKYRTALQQVQAAELLKSTGEKVSSLANLGNIQDEIDRLNQYGRTFQLNATQQLALDSLIHDAELKKQKDMDDLLLKTNSVGAGFKVFFDQYLNDGTTVAKKVADVMKTTVNDFTNTIADGLSKGKLDFQSFEQSVEAMLLKLALNQLFKSLIGLGLGFLNNSNFASSLGGGSLFGSGGAFGGGHAGGGDVSAGTSYLVGERGQEMFVPRTAGTIIPNDQLQNLGANGKPQGGQNNVYQTFNISTPNPDSFQSSQAQVTATGLNAALRSLKRNG